MKLLHITTLLFITLITPDLLFGQLPESIHLTETKTDLIEEKSTLILDDHNLNQSPTLAFAPEFQSLQSNSKKDIIDLYCFIDGLLCLIELQGMLLELESSEGVDRITSLEIRSEFGAFPIAYQLSSTRLQAHWGLFSGELRYNHQFLSKLEQDDHYSTLDLQFLQLNILPFRKWNVRMGFGTMRELNAAQTHPECTFTLDIYPWERFRFNLENRFAQNIDAEQMARKEWNMGLFYRLGKSYSRLNIHTHLNARIASYTQYHDLFIVSGGLSMRIE